MMRAPTSFAVVVRRRDGSLQVRERAHARSRRKGVARWPLVRGVASLVESLASAARRCASAPSRSRRTSRRAEAAASRPPARGLGILGAFGPVALRAGHAAPTASRRSAGDRREALGRAQLDHARRRDRVLRGAAAGRRPRASTALLHLGLEVQSAAVPGHHRRPQARDRRRLPARHPPHPRHPARLPVPRRRAQDDQHLRGGRGAHRRRTRARRRRCTRAAGRRSS